MNARAKSAATIRRLAAGFIAASLLCAAANSARAAGPACGPAIASCGCIIAKPGIYKITQDLLASQGLLPNGDCLDIKASHVTLLTDGYAMTGAGTGIGLHVLKGSKQDFVEGVKGKTSQAAQNFTTFSAWDIGVKWEGGNGILEDFQANENASVGVMLNRAGGNNINDYSALNNGVYGVWLQASSGNQINCSNARRNGNTGVYLGCSPSGPSGAGCKGVAPSNNNRIYDTDSFFSASDANGAYGIAIDAGNGGNIVTENRSKFNPSGDLFDNNPNCGTNLWIGNNFDSVAPPANAGCLK